MSINQKKKEREKERERETEREREIKFKKKLQSALFLALELDISGKSIWNYYCDGRRWITIEHTIAWSYGLIPKDRLHSRNSSFW